MKYLFKAISAILLISFATNSGFVFAKEKVPESTLEDAKYDAAVFGCTLALVNPQKEAYIKRGLERGNTNAEKEYLSIEPILQRGFKEVCSCVIKELSPKVPLENMGQTNPAMQEMLATLVSPPAGKCMPNFGKMKKEILDQQALKKE